MMKREADESNVFTYTLMVMELSQLYLLSKLTVDGAFNIHKQEAFNYYNYFYNCSKQLYFYNCSKVSALIEKLMHSNRGSHQIK